MAGFYGAGVKTGQSWTWQVSSREAFPGAQESRDKQSFLQTNNKTKTRVDHCIVTTRETE